MLNDYAPILILFAVVAAFAVGVTIMSDFAGRKRRNREKDSPYECGMDGHGEARLRISIHYYLVAVLFILFDVEALFLVLWASTAQSFGAAGYGALVFAEVLVFVLVLGLALAYVWRKGGLEWDR